MRKGNSVGLVAVPYVSVLFPAPPEAGLLNEVCTYLIRSKIVTLLPTGENKWVPSGLNKRLPLQYTVPSKLENWTEN